MSSDKTQLDIDAIFHKRYSGRAYDSHKVVSQEQLCTILEAAHLAPSCYNDQPWHFIVCNRHTDPEAYSKLLGCLVEFNQGWACNAPVLLVSVAASQFRRNGKPNRWGKYDTGSAAIILCLQTAALGLMAHQMGGFDETKVKTEFSIPDGFDPMAVIAIGYEVNNAEKIPRERLPYSTCIFEGSWGKAFHQ